VLPSDEIIVAALKSNDEKMFEQMFRHYYSSLCNYVINIIGDPDDAEDVVQQAMIGIWEKRNFLEVKVSLKSYLFRSVHNAALNKIRHEKVKSVHAEEHLHTAGISSETSSEILSGKELHAKISEAIEKLPEQCRMVFKLSRFEEMKYSEIASHLDISVKTVENHMGKALKLMREHLKDYLILLLVYVFEFILLN